MKIFITSLDNNQMIICPFLGIEWDGSYENMKSIFSNHCFKEKKLIPFKVSVLGTKRELICSKTVSHKQAVKDANWFLFDNKELIGSSVKLSGMFQGILSK